MDALTPYQLDAYLYQLSTHSLPLWYAEWLRSHDYRERAKHQHEIYYYERHLWEIGYKCAIACLGMLSFALGAEAFTVLVVTGAVLALGYVAFRYLGAIRHEDYEPIEPKEFEPTHIDHQQLKQLRDNWLFSYREHQVKEELETKKYRVMKTALAFCFGFALFLIFSTQLNVLLSIAAVSFLSTLLLEADEEKALFLEPTEMQVLS